MKRGSRFWFVVGLSVVVSGCAQSDQFSSSDFFFNKTTIAPPGTGTISSADSLTRLSAAPPYYASAENSFDSTKASPSWSTAGTGLSNRNGSNSTSGSGSLIPISSTPSESTWSSNSTQTSLPTPDWAKPSAGENAKSFNSTDSAPISIPGDTRPDSTNPGNFRPGSTKTGSTISDYLRSDDRPSSTPGSTAPTTSSGSPRTLAPPPASYYQSGSTKPRQNPLRPSMGDTRIQPVDYADIRGHQAADTYATAATSDTGPREEVVQVIQPEPKSETRLGAPPSRTPLLASRQTASQVPTLAPRRENAPPKSDPRQTETGNLWGDWQQKKDSSSAPTRMTAAPIAFESQPGSTSPQTKTNESRRGKPINIMDLPDPQPNRKNQVKPRQTVQDQMVRPVSGSRSSTNAASTKFEVPATSDRSANLAGAETARNQVTQTGVLQTGVQRTGVDTRYGYDPQYHWLRGELEYSEILGSWQIRYQPHGSATDPLGGCAVLTDISKLGDCERGDFFEVHGTLQKGADGNYGYVPEFQIQQVRKLSD